MRRRVLEVTEGRVSLLLDCPGGNQTKGDWRGGGVAGRRTNGRGRRDWTRDKEVVRSVRGRSPGNEGDKGDGLWGEITRGVPGSGVEEV